GLSDYYRLRSEPAVRAEETVDYRAWDRVQLARMHVRVHSADRAEVVVLVDGLRCTACAWLIEHAISALPGVHEVGVNAAARRVRLGFDPGRTSLSTLLAALARLGYAPHPLTADAIDSLREQESRAAVKRLAVAGIGTMQAMMYAVALYAGVFDGMDPAVRDFFRWLGFLVATPVVLYAARPFFAGARRELRARRVSMDTPVALAIALIYCASLIETLRGGDDIYFDSVSMFVFFLLIGRSLEMRARHRAGDVVDALARLQPSLAERRTTEGYESIGVHELQTGDTVRIAAGASIPADGSLRERSCAVDESLLSGESAARQCKPGDHLIAGSIALDGPIEITVTRVGADTVLAGIVRMVTRAASEKPELARLADARATRFVARVFALTVLTACAWLLVDPSRAFAASLAVLVVSCPCAFALAVPAALTRAIAVLAQRGVLVVDSNALEALANADHFVFDKTGTLTEPSVDLARTELERGTLDHALALAASLEQGNSHPLAAALRNSAASITLPPARQLQHVAGSGVTGVIDGVRYRLGASAFCASGDGVAPCPANNSGNDSLVLADDNGVIARFRVNEQPRAGVASLLDALRDAGIECEILSGDSPARVEAIAHRLGIRHWSASMRPPDKLDRLRALRQSGRAVAMVGDGVNDAPALAAADVGIAIGSGAALAHAASGILLSSQRLDVILEARVIAQRMLSTLRQNLNWALGYNLAVVPLAALGFVPPWLAALGMSASSIVVILNSLRIGRVSRHSKNTAVVEAGVVRERFA
ncbi:MAG: cation-translocating P-type ATPase, partial [Dokdonella sp.]